MQEQRPRRKLWLVARQVWCRSIGLMEFLLSTDGQGEIVQRDYGLQLQIKDADQLMSGTYSCVVTFDIGVIESNQITLLVAGKLIDSASKFVVMSRDLATQCAQSCFPCRRLPLCRPQLLGIEELSWCASVRTASKLRMRERQVREK